MSNLVDFLERMGRDPQLRHADAAQVELALESAQIEPALRAAMLSNDRRRLEDLLGAQANICCVVHAPGKDEPAPDDDEPAEGDEDDGKDETPQERRPGIRRAAGTH